MSEPVYAVGTAAGVVLLRTYLNLESDELCGSLGNRLSFLLHPAGPQVFLHKHRPNSWFPAAITAALRANLSPQRRVSARCISLLTLLLALSLCDVPAAWGRADSIRVWILASSAPEQVDVQSSSGNLRIRLRGPSHRAITVEDGHSVTVSSDGEGIDIVGPGTRSSVRAAVFHTDANGHLVVETSGSSRSYRGRLVVRAAPEGPGLRLINRVALEDYVTSVVPVEYPFDELEGAKAQAVIARTYAIHARESSTGDYDVTDNTASQAYRGVERETELSRRAVRETRGQILTYDDQPIDAVYSASGGGHTADNEDIWNTDPVPYLRGKPDPYDRSSPHQEWRFTISKSVLHDLLSREYGFAVQDVRFHDRTAEGRHRSVTLAGSREETITASSLRYVVSRKFGVRSLKSTLFRVSKTNDQYVFEGRGFGHGVGLSQWGTHARAEDGQSYDDILQFYYTSVALETLEGEQITAARPVRSETPESGEEPAAGERAGSAAPARSDLHGGWSSRKPVSIEQVDRRPVRPGW